MNNIVKFITRTAVLLALTVLFQSLRDLIPIPSQVSQFVVGSLVNLSLIISAVLVGIKGGLLISVAAPIIAYFQGQLPSIMPFMIVAVALGNAAIVIMVGLFYNKNKYAALVSGAVLKFITLYIVVIKIVLPFIYPNAPAQAKALLSVNFSWPQLVTALIGAFLSLIVIPMITKALKFDNKI
jgi:hypothetical protein